MGQTQDTFTPSTSQETKTLGQKAAERLLYVHQSLSTSHFYLGNETVIDHVQWVRDGRANRLVVKPGEDVNSASNDISNLPIAKLSAIVKIDRDDFWLTSDAGYQKPSVVWKTLAEVKPSCAITIPDVQPAKMDYPRVVNNLRTLQGKITTPGYQMGRGFFLAARGDVHRFKLRHVLFEVSVLTIQNQRDYLSNISWPVKLIVTLRLKKTMLKILLQQIGL